VPLGATAPNSDTVPTHIRALPTAPRESDPLLVARTVPGRYGLALLATVLTILGKEAVGPLVHPNAVLAFLPAVWFSARQGGVGPGLLCTAIAAVVGAWLVMPLGGSVAGLAAIDVGRVLFFVSSSGVVTWLAARQRRAVSRWGEALAAARAELEDRVVARTDDLAAANATLRDEISARAAAEEQFRSAFEHAPFGMALIGLDGQGLRTNDALAAMLGYEPCELRTLNIDDVHPAEYRGPGFVEFRRLVDGEISSYRGVRHLRHRSGRQLSVQVSVSLVRDGQGRPVHAVCHLQDLTERLEAERALQESEVLFRSLAEGSSAGIAIVQDGRFCYANAGAERNTGYARDELLRMSWADLVEAGQEAGLREWAARVEHGERGPLRAEVKITTRDGEPRWLDLMAIPITYRGRPARLSTGYDVTERVRAEMALRSARDQLESTVAVRTAELVEANRLLQAEVHARTQVEAALRESEARWRGVVEHLPAITYVVTPDAERRPTYISPQVIRYLGFTPEESMADPQLWERTIHPLDHDRVVAAVNASRVTGEPISLEHRMVAPDGTVTWFAHEVIKIPDATGTVQWFEGIMLDVTARKQAEHDLVDLNRRTVETLENMLEGCFVLDAAGITVYVNPSATKLLGKTRDELIGRNVFEVYPETVDTVFYEEFQRVRADRVARQVEGYSPPINRWLHAHMSPSGDGYAVLFEDVTERHERDVAAMSDVLNALNRHADPAAAWRDVAAALRRLTGCALSALCRFDDEHEWGRCVAHSFASAAPGADLSFRLAESRAVADILGGRPYYEPDIDDPPSDRAGRWLSALGMRSRLSLPLGGGTEVLGMLLLAWQEPHGGAPNLLPLLRQIADAVAIAVERSELFAEVQAGRVRLETLSQRLLEVQESERRHLARELHDEIGQALTGLRLQLEAAGQQSPAARNATLRNAYDEVSNLLERVRSMALDLRPAMLDDLGLLPALLWLLERYEGEAGIRVRFEHRDLASRRFRSDVETAAFRIVQEGLTNVARHAGVRDVTVRAWAAATMLGVQIVDTGVGFDPQAQAVAQGRTAGLSGMRERAVLLGGDLVVESHRGRGTTVSAELPLDTPVREEATWQSA